MPFHTNRKRIFEAMDENSVLFLESSQEKVRTNDTHYLYRQESDFYYATGFLEPNALLVLIKNDTVQKSLLFLQAKDPQKELWQGKVLGVDLACETLHIDQAFEIGAFETELPTFLKGATTLYMQHDTPSRKLVELYAIKARASKEKYAAIDTFKQSDVLLSHLRKVKSSWEIQQIQKALEITKNAHHVAMAMSRPKMHEYQIMAAIEYIFKSQGASGDAYTTIVASGDNANTLHYIENSAMLKKGDLVLIDAGAEFNLYASDITRTFPVNGTFSSVQKELYTIVLEAQKAAFKEIRPGNLRSQVNDAALNVLTQGLIDLKIIKETLSTALETQLYKPYYPHGIGHWMGLDVHDPLPYKSSSGDELSFVEGEVLTIEPGLYLQAHDKQVPKAFRGLGIRIEDDILVTKEGYKNLSSGIAKEIKQIEAACEKSLYDFI